MANLCYFALTLCVAAVESVFGGNPLDAVNHEGFDRTLARFQFQTEGVA